MRPEDFVEDSPGEIEMVDGVFTYSPDPLPPDLGSSHDLVRQNGDAMYALGQLSDLETWLDSPEVILSPLAHREAADSSNIETISRVTLSDLYRREAGEDVGTTETERADIAEAANYIDATNLGIELLDEGGEIDRSLLQRLHDVLMSGVRGAENHPGEFRDEIVGIGKPGQAVDDARFVPTPPASVPYALRSLLQYLRTGSRYATLVDVALVHYQFETIHSFHDGNGRMGRLLITLVLYDRGLLPGPYLYPSAYFNERRETYLDRLLAVSQEGAWTEWVEFFLEGIATQSREAYSVARELLALRERYRERYSGDGSVVRELIDFVIRQPYFTEPQAVEATGRSQPAINKWIRTLWDDGIVRETTGQQRNRRYEATEVLEVVEPY
jgi:Fic family protein